MSSSEHNRPGGKSGRRNQKREQQWSRKPDQQHNPQPDQQLSRQPDQAQDARELIDAEAVAPTDIASIGAVVPANTSPIGAVTPADTSPVGFQTIATAYRDRTRKSFEETRSFVEKLSGVRSLDKAFEIQSEFAKRAYESFVADSQKIGQLYGELAKQTLRPWWLAPTARRDK